MAASKACDMRGREEETRRSHDATAACSPRLLRLWLEMSIVSPQPAAKLSPLEEKDFGKFSLCVHVSAYATDFPLCS
jgi:hypothetical protein